MIKLAIESVTVPQLGLWMCSKAQLARLLHAPRWLDVVRAACVSAAM